MESPCPIWGVSCIVHPHNPNTGFYRVEGSYRAGGKYEIADSERYTTREDLKPDELARLTSFLIEQRMLGVEVPRITRAEVLRAQESNSLPVHERAERLLRLFVEQSSSIGAYLMILPLTDSYMRYDKSIEPDITQLAMAWSESTTDEELGFLVDYLAEQGWITSSRRRNDEFGVRYLPGAYHCLVEVPGYSRIEEVTENPDSSQCFVAMWFDASMDDVYEKGFMPAIEAAGYTPFRIKEARGLIGKIDDAIIAQIRRSRFVVADFTHGKTGGARGSVYYEAGFAHGLSLPVIFTCHKEMMGKVHFDVNHFNHILWENENLEDMRKQLTDRILAAIGQGPNRNG